MYNRDSSARIFADFTLSRIPADVRASFTEEQKLAIQRALVAQGKMNQHQLDVRVTVPLFFRRYYFVLLGGRDQRHSSLVVEKYRLQRLPKRTLRFVFLVFATLVTLAGFALIGGVLYIAKSMLGIDIFTDFHLGDVLPVDLYEIAKEWRNRFSD